MAKDKLEKGEDAINTLLKQRPGEGSELVGVDQNAKLIDATRETIVGVPELGDEELVGDFISWLQGKAEEASSDMMASIAQALRQAETATSIADALREPQTASSKDVCDRPFMGLGYTIHEGTYEDGELPFFASIEARFREIDEIVILNSGAFKVLAFLRAMDRLGSWPLPLVFKGRQTKKGRTVVSLALWDTQIDEGK